MSSKFRIGQRVVPSDSTPNLERSSVWSIVSMMGGAPFLYVVKDFEDGTLALSNAPLFNFDDRPFYERFQESDLRPFVGFRDPKLGETTYEDKLLILATLRAFSLGGYTDA